MRRTILAALAILAASLAAAQTSTTLTPLRMAVIHRSTAPSHAPGDCINGASPAVMAADSGLTFVCVEDGGGDYYAPIWSGTPWIDNSANGLTAVDDPLLSWTPAGSTGGGWRMFSGSGGAPYFQCAQVQSTGVVNCGTSASTAWVWAGQVQATSFSGPLTGNASTATALASNPSDCGANKFATTIAASGDLTCAAIADADVPDTITASNYQPLDANELSPIAGLTSAADKIPYYTGSGTAALASCDSACRGLLDDTTAAAQRATVGALYTIPIAPASQNAGVGLSSTSTYYWGGPSGLVTNTTQGVGSKIYIRKDGIIRIAEVQIYSTGTAGSGENISCYVRLNNTTDTLIATVGLAAAERPFTNTSINITVASGDYIEVKCVMPTFATAPTASRVGGYFLVE